MHHMCELYVVFHTGHQLQFAKTRHKLASRLKQGLTLVVNSTLCEVLQMLNAISELKLLDIILVM